MKIKGSIVKRHVSLPTDLVCLVEQRAEMLGLAFGNVVEDAILESLGLERDSKTALLVAIAKWVRSEPATFDIINRVFVQIEKTPEWLELYTRALGSINAEDEKRKRLHLNRRISICVTNVLGVETTERVPGTSSLIKTYPKVDLHLEKSDRISTSSEQALQEPPLPPISTA